MEIYKIRFEFKPKRLTFSIRTFPLAAPGLVGYVFPEKKDMSDVLIFLIAANFILGFDDWSIVFLN